MTDKAILKEKTTAHVRALLMSSPVPLTVNELKRDYFTFIGEQLRFRDMGFTTLEDFLRDIEDAVQIGWKNGLMTLSAKADEATKHIQSLVSRQKVDRKKKYAVLRNNQSSRYQGSAGLRNRGHGPVPPPPLVSAYVLGQIKQLLRCHTDGLPLTHFNNIFSKKYGQSLNFRRFGFGSLHELLYSLKDVVRLQELQGGEWWVRSADSPAKSAFSHPAVRSPVTEDTRGHGQGQEYKSRFSDDASNQKRPSKGRGRRRENSGDVNTKSVGSSGSHESSADLDQVQDSETRLKLEIRKVLEKHPEGLWARQLMTEYAAQFGKPLDYQEHGYVSVIGFVTAYPDIVRLDRPNPKSDWILYDTRLPVPQVSETKKGSPEKHLIGTTLEDTKDIIQKVLEMKPDGIPVSDFPEVFQALTGSKLPIQELGFATPEELFISLADTVLQLVYRGAGGFLVYPADADIDDDKMEEVDEVSSPLESHNSPAGVVGPGCHYTPIMPPEAGGYVELYVSNISSPALFWLQLRKKNAALALENLMDDLDYFYNSDSSRDYMIPDSLIAPGLVCAVIFPEDQNWHRGVVTGRNAEGFVQVYYVDYGNTNYVDKSSIRYLKLEYLKLPAQALQARMANIAPKDKVWKSSAKARMLKLCVNKPLIAYVTAVVEQVLSVCLTDTNSSEDVHINDLLVHEGYALFCPDTEEILQSAHLNQTEVPDYGHVYGWTTNREAPRLPAAARESKSESNSCYVKWVQLTKDHIIHMVNLEGVAYVVSAEISSLIWDEDILSSMLPRLRPEICMDTPPAFLLKKRHIDAPKVIITSEDHPRLFEDLRKYKVKSLSTELHGRKQFVSLYTLSSVPIILRAFDHPSADLIKAVEELDARFDPKGPYWKSTSTESAEASTESVDRSADSIDVTEGETDRADTAASREGRHIALQALQFKRKRILQMLMSDPSKTVEIVNELNNCEIEIRMIKDELDAQSNDSEASSSIDVKNKKAPEQTVPMATRIVSAAPPAESSVSVTAAASERTLTQPTTPQKQETENEKYVKNILASATKPIAAANIMTKPAPSAPVQTSPSSCQPSFTNNLVNQSAYRFPQMAIGSQVTGNNQPQLNPLLMQQRLPNMNQFGMNGAGNQLTGNSAGALGLNPFLMQQRMIHPLMLAQQGIVPGQMNSQQYAAQCPGLLPAVNPLLYQQVNNSGDGQMQPVSHLQMAGVAPPTQPPAMGRGQALSPGNMGLLPGLYPLLQNLTMGRGSLGPQSKKD